MTLFVWIPKTAGTSLVKSIPGIKIFTSNYADFDNTGNVTFGHCDVKLLLKHGIISAEYWRRSFKFTVVRNPYDRFISLYNDYKRSGRIALSMTMLQFAHGLLHVTRKPGMFNVMDFSQCASQHEWLAPDVTVIKFETIAGLLPVKENASNRKLWQHYYKPELIKLVNELYRDDLILFNYEIL